MIRGEKVVIRGIQKEDASQIYKWVNEEQLRDFTGTLYPVSEFEHEKWIANVTTSQNTKLFAICVDNKCIGTIGLKNFDTTSRNVELYISIGENNLQNNGYGSDAVSTLTRFCFEHLNIHKVYLKVFASNKRAVRCYEKAGFIEEGMLKEHHFSKGKYEDILILAKIYDNT